MTCPFCDSADVERIARWGGQIITAQWRCEACSSYFEAVREDFEERVDLELLHAPRHPARRVRAPDQ